MTAPLRRGWITPAQAARLLGVSQGTISRLAAAGKLRPAIDGNRRWYRRTHVLRLAEKRRQKEIDNAKRFA